MTPRWLHGADTPLVGRRDEVETESLESKEGRCLSTSQGGRTNEGLDGTEKRPNVSVVRGM